MSYVIHADMESLIKKQMDVQIIKQNNKNWGVYSLQIFNVNSLDIGTNINSQKRSCEKVLSIFKRTSKKCN